MQMRTRLIAATVAASSMLVGAVACTRSSKSGEPQEVSATRAQSIQVVHAIQPKAGRALKPEDAPAPDSGLNAPDGGCGNINAVALGGPVLANVQPVIVYSGSVWPYAVQELPGFFNHVVNGPNAFLNWLSEYDGIGPGSYDGTTVFNVGLPSLADGAMPSLPYTVDDQADIQPWIASLIHSGQVPFPGPETVYMVYLPPQVKISLAGELSCDPIGNSFCAYHFSFVLQPEGVSVPYAMFPDFSPLSSCSAICGIPGGTTGAPFDTLTSTTSHELMESITDPLPNGTEPNGPAWVIPLTFEDEEIADQCVGLEATWEGYTVQQAWSNATCSCFAPPSPTVGDGQLGCTFGTDCVAGDTCAYQGLNNGIGACTACPETLAEEEFTDCNSRADCCSGSVCTIDPTLGSGTCASCGDSPEPVGFACDFEGTDCCGNQVCVVPHSTSELPTCQNCPTYGNFCNQNADCCPGLDCDSSHQCAQCPFSGNSCTSTADCCDGNLCDNGTCLPCTQGSSCANSSDCCGSTVCGSNGLCDACGNAGEQCCGGSCAAGLVCQGGTCINPAGCAEPGGSCVIQSCCPTGSIHEINACEDGRCTLIHI